MAFDGLMISAIIYELSENLLGGRIDRVFQPEGDEVVLSLRNKGANHRLLLSANANFPRLHLAAGQKENPLTAPMFCMLLRKHIQGGRLTAIDQPDFERVVRLHIEGFNEMGDVVQKILIIEIMGKYSNIILVEDGRVLDSAKHVSYGQSSVRQILPGRDYVPAPSQNKRNPLLLNREDFFALCTQGGQPARKLIYQNYTGLSPFSAGLICALANVEAETPPDEAQFAALFNAFANVMEKMRQKEFTPYALRDADDAPAGFAVFGQELYDDKFTKSYNSPSHLIEDFFAAKDNFSRIRQKSQDLRRLVQNLIERCVKKADLHEATVAEAADRGRLKNFGELITANIYAIPMGATSFAAINFYDENMPEIQIPLDPAKTAAENAQMYFGKYNKQKRAVTALQEQMAQNQEELLYLEGVREALNHCIDEADLAQIREELAAEGFVKKAPQSGKKQRIVKAKPLHFVSSDGFDIFVGKNNAQNDELTLRFADQHDIWLHTKSIPGSHVILRAKGGKVSDTALEEAAGLAAYYSKGRDSGLVAVDYCPRRQVSKPRGAKPGMVIYEGHKTAFVASSGQKPESRSQ